MPHIYPGTKNGSIVKWKEPISEKAIFEWDEDIINGSHNHILDMGKSESHMGFHYWPGDPIPEPWNSLYFGGIE